jgi:YacP-like NYN domain
MPYLLDGNNLIGAVRGRAGAAEEDRSALVAEIADRLRGHRARAVLYFDGPAARRPASLGNLTVRAGTGGSADDAIVRDVERARDPSSMIVVTADRELHRRVRDAGGRICRPSDFFANFGKGRRPEKSREESPAVDVEDWLRYFRDGGSRDRE